MKTFLKTVCGIALAMLFVSCSANNTGYNTGNVSVDLGNTVPALASAFFGQPLQGRPRQQWCPPQQYRNMVHRSYPAKHRIVCRDGQRYVYQPRTNRCVGVLAPNVMYDGQYGPGYQTGGQYYGRTQGGSGGRRSGLQPDYESRYVRSGRDGSPNSVRDTGEIYYQTARGQTRAK